MTAHRAGRRRPLPSKPFKKKITTNKKEEEKEQKENMPVDAQSLVGMLAKVQQHIDMFQYEEARDLCLKAVLLAPEDADIRYQLGSICLELGDFQGGFENIRLSLNLEPETTPDRFFAFAQLIPGREAVEVYEHGLKVYSDSDITTKNGTEFKRKVSTACCAAAEIFMTDLCEDVDAEVQCSTWLDRAMKTDPLNPEVYRVMADLRMCQQEQQKSASELVLRACQLWNEELERLMNPDESTHNHNPFHFITEFPSYESRISAAKILVELSLFENAVQLLEQLLREDDSVLMTWYLLCFALRQQISNDGLVSALEDALEGSLRVARRDGHLQYPSLNTDDELVQEILAWAQEINLKVDLDGADEDERDGAVLDLEAALLEAEKLDNQ